MYLQWSKPLESPLPFYDSQEDRVLCYSIPRYGVHRWNLPPMKIELAILGSLLNTNSLDPHSEKTGPALSTAPVGFRDTDLHFRWFARYLLN